MPGAAVSRMSWVAARVDAAASNPGGPGGPCSKRQSSRRSASEDPASTTCDRIAATDRLLERSRERVTAAMAQVRHVDRLRPGAQRSVARPPAGGAGAEHVTEVLHDELAAHLRAVRLHEQAAQLQERWGLAGAGGHRPLRPRRPRPGAVQAAHRELVSRQARVGAAVDKVGQAQRRPR
jgi:hypothetical protein